MIIRNALLSDLHTLARTPKNSEDDRLARSDQRRAIHEKWSSFDSVHRSKLLPKIIRSIEHGKISPTKAAARRARRGDFRKHVGPSVNLVSSWLDAAEPNELANLYSGLNPREKSVAESVRCRKPWTGLVDPFSKPFKPFLKNRSSIGTLPDAALQNGKLRIGVVGAGLTAKLIGLLLNQTRADAFDLHFFEREPQMGGRMCTTITPAGTPLEGGAMRLPASGKTIHYFFRLLGIGHAGERTVPFPNMGSHIPGVIYFKGEKVLWHPHAKAPDHPLLRHVIEKFEHFSNELLAPLNEARAKHDMPGVMRAWQKYIDEFKGMTVREMLEEKCHFTEEEIDAFAKVGLVTGGLDSYLKTDISALEIAREITADLTLKQGLLPNGARNAVERLGTKVLKRADGTHGAADDISHSTYGVTVTKVSHADDKPTIHYRDANGTDSQETFDFVFVTPPPGAAKHIDLGEVLAPAQIKAIKNCSMMDSTKLIAQTAPVKRDINGKPEITVIKAIQTDLDDLNSCYHVSFPVKDLLGKPTGEMQDALYLDYIWDHRDITTEQYQKSTVRALEKVAPEMAKLARSPISELYHASWREKGGAFRELRKGTDDEHLPLAKSTSSETLAANAKNTLIASADHEIGGYTESAARVAIKSVATFLTHVGGSVHADFPKDHHFRYGTEDETESLSPQTATPTGSGSPSGSPRSPLAIA